MTDGVCVADPHIAAQPTGIRRYPAVSPQKALRSGGALPWLLLVLLAAWIGQLVGSSLFSPDISGFFGAVVMTPIALAAAKLPGGPPSQVTFLPAFWLLVPGALGLVGVTEIVGDPAHASLSDLVTPLGSIVLIALGVLAGVSIYRGVAATPRRLLRH